MPFYAGPGPIAFDKSTGDVWVGPSFDYDPVNVVDSVSGKVIHNVSYPRDIGNGDGIVGIAVDSANGLVYLASDYGNVTIVNGSTFQTVKTIWVGDFPRDIVYDKRNGDLYVVDTAYHWNESNLKGNVTVISGSTNTIITQISRGGWDAVVDPSNGYVYLSDGNNLSRIDPDTNLVVKTVSGIHLSSETTGNSMVFNSINNEIYGTDSTHDGFGSGVIAINSSTMTASGSISLGSAYFWNWCKGIAFDPVNGDLYVVGAQNSSRGIEGVLSVVDTSKGAYLGSVALEGLPQDLVTNTADGDLYVTSPYSGMLWVFSPTAPRPGPTFPNLQSDNAGWAVLGIFIGAVFILVGIRRYWRDRKKDKREAMDEVQRAGHTSNS